MKSLTTHKRSDSEQSPYRKLWRAVLMGALKDLQGYPQSALDGQWRRREARPWFKSPDNGIGSLNWVCEITNLDADTVRRYVLSTPSAIYDLANKRAPPALSVQFGRGRAGPPYKRTKRMIFE